MSWLVSGIILFGLLVTALIAYLAERGDRLKSILMWWGVLGALAIVIFCIARGMDEEHIDFTVPSTSIVMTTTPSHT
jgi:hypothetical protein